MAKRRGEVAVLDDDTDAIDDAREQGQADPEPASEGELEIARKVAKRLGWTPKEEWTRDPDKWRDADEFLENTPREIETLKERLKRTGQAAADAIEEERRRTRVQAEANLRAAAEAGDADAAVAEAERLARASGPHPETQAWMARNPWFDADPIARAAAAAEVERVARERGTIAEQLEAAERLVRRRFPEHFGEVRQEPRETRLSDARRPAPAVAPGVRTANSAPREKAWNDIPKADRDQAEKHFLKRFQSWGKSPEEARAMYAKSYWREKD